MSEEEKVDCVKCGNKILPVTAKLNEGRCMPCAGNSCGGKLGKAKRGGSSTAEDVADSMTFLMQLGLGIFFGVLFAGFVGAIASQLWGGLVWVTTPPSFILGFLFGYNLQTIRLLFDWF